MLRASDMDWTIVYASVLSDGPATGSVSVLAESAKRGMAQRISRADVAAWLVQAATGAQYGRRSVGTTGSTRTRSAYAA